LDGLSIDLNEATEFEIPGKYRITKMKEAHQAVQMLVSNDAGHLKVSSTRLSACFAVSFDATVPAIDYKALLQKADAAKREPAYQQPPNMREHCFPFGRFSAEKGKLCKVEESTSSKLELKELSLKKSKKSFEVNETEQTPLEKKGAKKRDKTPSSASPKRAKKAKT